MARAAADWRRVATERVAQVLRSGGGLLVVAPLWMWWAAWKGGYPPAVFLPAIAYLTGGAAVLHWGVERAPLAGALKWAVVAVVAFAAWSLASILWADDRGAAEVAAGRQVLFAASFALPAMWRPAPRALVACLGVFVAAALLGGATALAAVIADPVELLDGRLVGPTEYVNASAALYGMGLLAALGLGSSQLSAATRVAALASASALGSLLVLTQTRGGSLALVIALVVAIAVTPRRGRMVAGIGIVGLAVACGLDQLLDVRTAAVGDGDVDVALRVAARTLVAVSAIGAIAGGILVWVEHRIVVPDRIVRSTRRATTWTAAALAVVGLAIALLFAGSVTSWVGDRWESFKTPNYSYLEEQDTRFGGDLGSNRWEYWRVSVDAFGDAPILGAGAGNFIATFLERREVDHSTTYAHSSWLGALAELGAVGLALAIAFAVALSAALLAAGRTRQDLRLLVVAGALPWVYLLVHGSFDWVGAFPAVQSPALALAAGAAALGTRSPVGRRRGGAGLWLTVALAVATISFFPIALAARLSDRGAETWRERPNEALADLRRAADLDPLAASPLVREGVVAVDLRRWGVARAAFERARRRDPSSWYPSFQLGLLAARRGDRRTAIRSIESALARNPRDRTVRRALEAVRAGGRPNPALAQGEVLQRGADG